MGIYDFESFLQIRSAAGFQLRAHCPFHDDRNPSFSADTETGLWICHAGCGAGSYEAFVSRIRNSGVTRVGLTGSRRKDKSQAPKTDFSDFSKVDEYLYFDWNGTPSLRVTRYENAAGSNKTFLREHFKRGCWVPGRTGEMPVLPYRFEDWGYSGDPFVIVVEGEKCVRYLTGLGYQATTFPGGANGWRQHFGMHFQGKHVVIIPDNDPPGMKFARDVQKGLAGVAQCRIVELPGLGSGEDVVDWLKRNQDLNAFRDLIQSPPI